MPPHTSERKKIERKNIDTNVAARIMGIPNVESLIPMAHKLIVWAFGEGGQVSRGSVAKRYDAQRAGAVPHRGCLASPLMGDCAL